MLRKRWESFAVDWEIFLAAGLLVGDLLLDLLFLIAIIGSNVNVIDRSLLFFREWRCGYYLDSLLYHAMER